MNIFVTSTNQKICAQEHCDVHLRKMIVETAQLLATAHYELDGTVVAYKPTHKNHPCVIWVRQHPANYMWTAELLRQLLSEYYYRFEKSHKTGDHAIALGKLPVKMQMSVSTLNASPLSFVMAMPDKYKSKSVETSYQSYLNDKFKEWLSREKPMKLGWTKRSTPSWVSV